MRIILKTLTWVFIVAALLAAALSILGYTFVTSREVRQKLFPIDWQWNGLNIRCEDLVVTSPQSSILKDITVNGQGFSLKVPEIKLEYSPYPPELRKVVLVSPELKVKISKSEEKNSIPYRTIRQASRIAHVEDGRVWLGWNGGEASFSSINVEASDNSSTGVLTRGSALFSLSAKGTAIEGRAEVGFEKKDYRLHIDAHDITAHLPGLLPVNLAAQIETGILPEDLGRFSGDLQLSDATALIPITLRDSAAIKERVENLSPFPVAVKFSVNIIEGAIFSGTLPVPLELFPKKFVPSAPPSAKYQVVLNRDFLSGSFSIDVPDLATKLEGSFANQGNGAVKWQVSTSSEIKNYAFYLDDNHAVEGLSATASVKLDGRSRTKGGKPPPVSWNISAKWDRGDLLLYPWYFDLSSSAAGTLAAQGSLQGDYVRIQEAGLLSLLNLHIKNISLKSADLKRLKKAHPRDALLRLVSKRGDIIISGSFSQAYPALVRDPFEAGHAILGEIEPEGNFSVRLNALGADIKLDADLRWRDREVVKGLGFSGIIPLKGRACNASFLSWDHISLPVNPMKFQGNALSDNTTATEQPPKKANAQADAFSIDAGSLPLQACADRIIFGPVTIPAGKGKIEIEKGEVTFDTGALKLSGINIKELHLTTMINKKPVEAVLSGKRLDAEVRNGRISVQGTLHTEFAKGTVEISGLWLEFSGPVPRFGADIRFQNIDIATLTALTDFGRITGRLDGKVTGLVISGSQPESFDLELRSRKSKDQEISIKAIRNLSILGGGGGGIPLLGQFFKNFSYSSIGVSCRLRNDIFAMHGLIREGDTEYIVKRGFWGGVNVINQNPGGKIAFSDMLERLARITKSGTAKVE